jgi:hypothetical protein
MVPKPIGASFPIKTERNQSVATNNPRVNRGILNGYIGFKEKKLKKKPAFANFS